MQKLTLRGRPQRDSAITGYTEELQLLQSVVFLQHTYVQLRTIKIKCQTSVLRALQLVEAALHKHQTFPSKFCAVCGHLADTCATAVQYYA